MPQKKHRLRTMDKMHLLIRAELANPMMSSTEVAALCGLSIWKFSVLKATPMYRQLHNTYMTGLLSSYDNKVNDAVGLTQETMNLAIPVAMQKLVAQMIQDKDMKIQNKACNDLLDRHGRFAKVKRVGAPTDEQGRGIAEDKDNKAVSEMLKMLEKTAGEGAGAAGTSGNSGSIPPAADIKDTPTTGSIN